MKQCLKEKKPSSQWRFGALLAIVLMPLAAWSQEKSVGDLADDFELFDVLSEQPVKLTDFAGSIVVLDFFSYW